MVVTAGKVIISAEVRPLLKERIDKYAASQGISSSKVIRTCLEMTFFSEEFLKEAIGATERIQEAQNGENNNASRQ